MNTANATKPGKVSFIGAGPGAADLITVRGLERIRSADRIIFAGSLVNKALFEGCRAPIHDSSSMHLEEIASLMIETCSQGGNVARVHTGDPALYGAIKEQIVRLEAAGVGFEIVPGVTSAFGAAAALGAELTLPEVTQSVIFTRRGGRTPVPVSESLDKLAVHGATMMIFLSASMIEEVVSELLEGAYSLETPVSVVARATWPDEQIVRGTLGDIATKVTASGIRKTALICVGDVFGVDGFKSDSKLYNREFSHGLRDGDNHRRPSGTRR
jgi:precorrin-4/cobalt-precorrin-4 C11-methyltransferase